MNKNSVKIPDKKTMNLCMRDTVKSTNRNTLIAGILIIPVLIGVTAKFGVIDQYARLADAENTYNDAKSKNDAAKVVVDRYPQVREEYLIYSSEWLYDGTVKDTVALERTDMLDLFEKVLMKRGTVKGIKAYGDTVTVTMSGMNLDGISEMLETLKSYDYVGGASLNSASTEEDDLGNLLDFTITVVLVAGEVEN